MQAQFNPRQLSELVLTVGFYMMASRFLENFEVAEALLVEGGLGVGVWRA